LRLDSDGGPHKDRSVCRSRRLLCPPSRLNRPASIFVFRLHMSHTFCASP
jgi:hypothetical protein